MSYMYLYNIDFQAFVLVRPCQLNLFEVAVSVRVTDLLLGKTKPLRMFFSLSNLRQLLKLCSRLPSNKNRVVLEEKTIFWFRTAVMRTYPASPMPVWPPTTETNQFVRVSFENYILRLILPYHNIINKYVAVTHFLLKIYR